MKIIIDEVLASQGKTRYWLAKEIGFAYHNLVKLCEGKTTSIKFELIENICKALKCTPNDIFKED